MKTDPINEIIEWSKGNTAGTILNKEAIKTVVYTIWSADNVTIDYIDYLLDKYQTDSGYMVKATNIHSILKL